MSVKAGGKQWQVNPRFGGIYFKAGILIGLFFDPKYGNDMSL
jgi:hypothetical protein